MSEPLNTASDGPNTHVYRDVRFVYEWTVVPLVDPDGVRHLFHVPTAILAAERAASERPPVDPLREAAQDLLDNIRMTSKGNGGSRPITQLSRLDALRAALSSQEEPEWIINPRLRSALASPAVPRPEGPLDPEDYDIGDNGAVIPRLSDTGEGEHRDVRRRDCGCLVDDNQTLTLCDTHSDTGEGEK